MNCLTEHLNLTLASVAEKQRKGHGGSGGGGTQTTAEVAKSHVSKEEGDGEDEPHNVISRVKQRQYVLQSSLDTVGLLLPANENLTHRSRHPSTLNMDTHTHTHSLHAYHKLTPWSYCSAGVSDVKCQM